MGTTMNDKSINSLISAYHDGELTAAERTEVERLLQSSPEARAELEAYRRVSQVLREACRAKLNADLTPSVMQAVKRLPARPTTAPQKSSSLPAWTRWAAMVAVAASLIVAVTITWRPGQPNQNIAKQQPTNVTTPLPEKVTKTQPTDVNVADNGRAVNNTIAENRTVNNKTAPQLVQLDPKDIPLDVIEDLKKAPPAKIVRFLKRSGDDVAVFHLMVLDTKPGLDSLQMILSAQQITGPKGQAGPSGVMAVYVEAKQDQLDKVIAELQSESQKQFVALAVQQQPVKVEDIQKVVKGQSAQVAAQVPLKEQELKTVGVVPVESEHIEVALKGAPNQSAPSGNPFAIKKPGGNVSPMKKVLIVLEKVPESLMPKSAGQPN